MEEENSLNGNIAEQNACQKELKSVDAIMKPDIVETITRFVGAGGKPDDAVHFLSTGYRGHAQMVNLICSWLALCGYSTKKIQNAIEERIRDEILDKFNPSAADTLFKKKAGDTEWFDQMIKCSQWRTLFYKLAAKFPECLLINYAIQRISDLGFSEELYSNTNSIATLNFKVFNKILTDFIPKLLCSDENSLNDLLPDFINICTQNVHTYFYTQSVLSKLIKAGISPAVRISQELFFVARQKSPTVAALLGNALHDIVPSVPTSSLSSISPELTGENVVVTAVKSAIANGEFSDDEIVSIYNAYSENRNLSPSLIDNFAVIETLTRQLFVPSDDQKVDNSMIITLLCYATTYKLESKGSLMLQQQQQQQQSNIEDKSERESLVSELRRKNPSFKELEDIITPVVPLCTRDIVHARDPVALSRVAEAAKRSAIVASGVIEWIRNDLLSTSFFKIVTFADINRVHFELIRLVLSQYPVHRRAIFNMLVDAYTARVPEKISEGFRLEVIRLFIDLFFTGYTKPVLEKLSVWAEQRALDLSHLRSFFENVLSRVEKPYSPQFMRQMVETIGRECVYSSLSAHNLERQKFTYRAIKNFLIVCSENSAQLPIDCSKIVDSLLTSVFTHMV